MTAETQAALDAGVRPAARSMQGAVVEIDLARQVLFLVEAGRVDVIVDTSSGRPGRETPAGEFEVYRQIDSANVTGMYRPKYFYEPRALAIRVRVY